MTSNPSAQHPTNSLDEPKMSAADRRNRDTYLREFLPAIIGYAVVLIAVLSFVDEDTTGARLWILLPVIPMALAGLAVYRSVQRSDEYSRLVQLESLALGFGAMILASLVFGFLGVVGVAITWSGWIIFGAGMLTWGLALGLRAS